MKEKITNILNFDIKVFWVPLVAKKLFKNHVSYFISICLEMNYYHENIYYTLGIIKEFETLLKVKLNGRIIFGNQLVKMILFSARFVWVPHIPCLGNLFFIHFLYYRGLRRPFEPKNAFLILDMNDLLIDIYNPDRKKFQSVNFFLYINDQKMCIFSPSFKWTLP